MTGTRLVRLVGTVGATAALATATLLVADPAGAQVPAEWNVDMVGGPAAGGGVTIAVVDSGVAADHYAFGGAEHSRVLTGRDFVDGDTSADDTNGHGTHVAGIAAGGSISCDGRPTAIGVAPDASILPVRVLDGSSKGDMADVIAGIDYAVEQGADVINLSLGETPSLLGLGGDSAPFLDALSRAWQAGSIPVLAAGNTGGVLDTLLFPQGYDDVDAVVVTAVDADARRTDYAVSSSSAPWGVAAPGGTSSRPVTSSLDRQRCGGMSGTSMAAPHVSGALAVLRSRGLDPEAAVRRLSDTARPGGSGTGAGVIDLDAALDGLPASTTTTSSTSSTTSSTPGSTTSSASAAPSTVTTDATSTSTTTTDASDDERAAPVIPPGPVDDDVEVAADMTLERDADSIPGGAAALAALGVVLGWMGWLAALRRHLT